MWVEERGISLICLLCVASCPLSTVTFEYCKGAIFSRRTFLFSANCVNFAPVCHQARNIAVCIEFKDSDEEEVVSLKVKLCPGRFLRLACSSQELNNYLFHSSASMVDLEDPCLPKMPLLQFYITSRTLNSTMRYNVY